VLVASMHAKVLSEFRKVCPEVATSAGPESVLVFYLLNKVGLTSFFPADMAAFQVPIASRGRRIATPGFVMAAHRRNLIVEVWTVNDPDEMQRLLKAGVDGIFTDFPGRLKSVAEKTLRQRGGSNRAWP
jgi:glycerophosphoryl diester phosphodiesterase